MYAKLDLAEKVDVRASICQTLMATCRSSRSPSGVVFAVQCVCCKDHSGQRCPSSRSKAVAVLRGACSCQSVGGDAVVICVLMPGIARRRLKKSSANDARCPSLYPICPHTRRTKKPAPTMLARKTKAKNAQMNKKELKHLHVLEDDHLYTP